ncbi:hypothetical protein EDI_210920 [Entamoeba dispar SAW760]|uniref:Uncharacterized protein n=1 Tax=Entamoeba dispar (strain ATCC PRA-260 / SAW760) TaxID=370354 RepID=B0E6D6_ENTDS|nr:uncharacterized protein EDI_210920 [Entamoeba dispar SAW760]XP_001740479.1 uncharacterized protein EDI_236110 [Entamoeba dispar SAW760]EDR23107.1 hypothetical protein EDI_236110 [Entamoeba dispar SAW760]EDR29912.1 hypothetical protein EDI_210920 [Entamoeba dispar SAW760]|eukprot:EDR23107.1 hypothetical protein EDI_236110 [Entamoeba dispar SAW760]
MKFGFFKKLKNIIKTTGKKLAGIGGKLYKRTGNITKKLIPISKGIVTFLPGGEIIGNMIERIPKWYETNGKALTEISEGKKIKDIIQNYGKTLYNNVILNKEKEIKQTNNNYNESRINKVKEMENGVTKEYYKRNLSSLSPYEQEIN